MLQGSRLTRIVDHATNISETFVELNPLHVKILIQKQNFREMFTFHNEFHHLTLFAHIIPY